MKKKRRIRPFKKVENNKSRKFQIYIKFLEFATQRTAISAKSLTKLTIVFMCILFSLRILYNKQIDWSRESMRKQVILIMEGNSYPFGQADQSAANKSKPDARILVRKKHQTRSLLQRNQFLEKTYTIKAIQSAHLMKIQTVLEEENSVHLLYEYVPKSLMKNIRNLSSQDVEKIRDHLLDLASNLAQSGFGVEWDIKNVGINDNNQPKYYLDLDRIGLEKGVDKNVLQREHFKSIMNLFSGFITVKEVPKNPVSHARKKQVDFQVPQLLYARPTNSIESNSDPKNIKIFPQAASASQQKINQVLELPKSKQPPKQIAQKPKTPLRKSRTNWKQIDHNEEFMQDFMNVLDDKSQNAQSKYISDEEHENKEGDEHEDDQHQDDDEPEDEDEEIVWVSAPEERHEEAEEHDQQKSNDEEEEIVWVDYRDFKDIRERAEAAIQRSTQVLEVFKNILARRK